MAAPDGPPPRAPRLAAAARREQLAQVAAQRFHLLGYHRVSLGDVGSEAGVTGPAVYRHFRSKEALLAAAVTTGLDLVEAAVVGTGGAPLDDLVRAVAEVGVRRPDMWVLLQRETRFLSAELRAPISAQFDRIVAAVSERLSAENPAVTREDASLLVAAALAVLSLPSTTHTSLDSDELRAILADSAMRCLRTDLVAARAADTEAVGLEPDRNPTPPRREQVVDTAVDLFFARGYSGVSLDDIGAAVGMAGPSILHHFATKADILVSAFDRASGRLAQAQSGRRASGGPTRLEDLVASYIRFCLDNRSLLGVYVSEPMYLPPDALARTQATIRTELRDWTRLLLATSLDLDEAVARVRVRAATAAINDLVRLGHLAERPRVAAEILAVSLAVLRG